eukprot:UN31585
MPNKPVVQPRAPSATSISSLLRTFQEEWDALLLEHYQLQKHVATVRQELSHALYQHDAACRVIARITQERDKARAELAETRKNMSAALAQTRAQEGDMDVDSQTGIKQDLVEKIKQKATELQKWRKGRAKKPEGLASKSQLGALKEISTNSLHSPSDAGILCMALDPRDGDLVYTGGQDTKILCWNRKTKKVMQTMGDHKKKVLVLKAHKQQNVLLSGSADKTVKIWTKQGNATKFSCAGTLNNHGGSVNDIHIHPLGDYFVSCSDDSSWAFSNLLTQQTVQSVTIGGDTKFSSLQLHPDGRLLGTGDNKKTVQIWELHNQNSIVTLEQSKAPITSICFSENGYHLAASCSDGEVKVYDLRKTNLLHSFPAPGKGAVNKVSYDLSGQYLLCSGRDLRVLSIKKPGILFLFLKKSFK